MDEISSSDARMAFYWLIVCIAILAFLLSMEDAKAYNCSIAPIWPTMNDTTVLDPCGGFSYVNNSMPSVTGVFQEAKDWESGDLDRMNFSDGAYEVSTSRSWGVWIRPESVGANMIPMSKRVTDSSVNIFITQMTNNSLRCSCGNAGTWYSIYSNAYTVSVSNWYHVVCTYDSTGSRNLSIYVNGTLRGSRTVAAACADTNTAPLTFGCYSNGGTAASACDPTMYYDGRMDSAFYSNSTLTPTEVNYIWQSDDTVGPPAPIGCLINLTSPPDGDHNNTATPQFNATLICYALNMPDRCWVTMNGTASGDNITALVNGSSFLINANSSKAEGMYLWNISCNSSGAINISAYTWNLTIDLTNPRVLITWPKNPGMTLFYNASNLTATCQDTYVWNFTCDVLYSNGTIQASYTNGSSSYGNTTFNLYKADFTSQLDYGTGWWVNCSCMDAHTKNQWTAKEVKGTPGNITIESENSKVLVEWKWTEPPVVNVLKDRIEWGVNTIADKNGKIEVKFKASCLTGPLYYLFTSNYSGHFICGNMWSDFQDLVDDGFKVSYEIDEKNLVVNVQKDGFKPGEVVLCHPSSGGLNIGYATANVTIAYGCESACGGGVAPTCGGLTVFNAKRLAFIDDLWTGIMNVNCTTCTALEVFAKEVET